MRLSRHLLILALLTAAVCSDRDAALAATPDQPRSVATQSLIRRLSAQLRAAIATQKLRVDFCTAGDAIVERSCIQPTIELTRPLPCWLLNLPPPARA